MTVIDIEDKGGTWFEMEGGGKVQIRTITTEDFKAIQKQTVKKRVDFKKVDGTPGRFEYQEVNEDLQNELFWDAVILGWENLFDAKENPIPCTKANKLLLMSRSAKFVSFISDSLKSLQDDEALKTENAEKN